MAHRGPSNAIERVEHGRRHMAWQGYLCSQKPLYRVVRRWYRPVFGSLGHSLPGHSPRP
jgi:hypothetical protein